MFLSLQRVLIVCLSVKCSFVHASAEESDISFDGESSFIVLESDTDEEYHPRMYGAGMQSLQDSLKQFTMKVDSVDRVSDLITLYTDANGVGDVIRYRDLQELPGAEETSLEAMKDDSRLLEYLLRYKILTELNDQAEGFVDDIDVLKSSDLKWIPGKLNDLRGLMNELKNEIWWLRKKNVMEYVQNIHKRLMKVLIMVENISKITSSAVIGNILTEITHFVRHRVNPYLEAAY